ISLNGSWVEQNDRDTRDFYGRYLPFQTILKGNVQAPPAAQNFVSTIARYTMPAGATQAEKPTVPTGLSQHPAQGTAPATSVQRPASSAQPSSQPQNSAPTQNQTQASPQNQTSSQTQMQAQPQGTSTVPK